MRFGSPYRDKQMVTTESPAGRLEVATFAERPDLLAKVFDGEIQSAMPEFMRRIRQQASITGMATSTVSRIRAGRRRSGRTRPAGGAGFQRPVRLPRSIAQARDAARWRLGPGDPRAQRDLLAGVRATAVSALEIMVTPRLQGRGISRVMLAALRDNARRLGFAELYAPLRPTDKHREPLTPFAEYVARRREDGLPVRFLGAHPSPPWCPGDQGGALQHGDRRDPRRVA